MARSVLLRQKIKPRRRRLSAPGAIRFAGSLALTAPAVTALIGAFEAARGEVALHDAAQGGLLAFNDQATGFLARADAALYDVQITESV